MEYTGAVNLARPFKPFNSIKKIFSTTVPPHLAIKLSAAAADPPVAIKSSKITTLEVELIAVWEISNES